MCGAGYLHPGRKRMASFGLMFIFMFLLMQCEIADVVASASTTSSPMSPRATLFGSTIIKTYSSNLTSAGSSAIQRTAGNTSDSAATGCSKQDSSSTRIDKQQTSILLDESKRRIWCFGPHADSKVKNQRYYLPVRFLSVLRRKDMIILPGNHQPIREFVDFVVPLLGLSHDQIIWTDGNSVSIDADIDTAILNGLKERILLSGQSGSFGSNWVLVPYCVTKDFLGWSSGLCKQFSGGNHHDAKTISSGLDDGEEKVPVQERGPGLEVFGETELWNSKYGHKGILHRHIADLSVTSIIEDIDKGDAATSALTALESIATTVAKGYQCSTVEHLLEAYKLLKKETFDDRAVIKPITGCAGWGIVFIDSVEELLNYDFPMGEVLLEEMLNLDLTEDGHVISPAVHYLGQNLFGGQLVDQLMKSTTYLGWRESKADPIFQKKVLDMTEKLLRFTQPKGPGGYDFLSVNGEPVLSDVNTGRFNGAHQPKLFLSQYAAKKSMWYCWKHKPSVSVGVSDVWNALSKAGLAFNPASEGGANERIEGVFPLTYLRGIDGIFIAIANTTERAYEIYGKAATILNQLEVKFL